MEIYSQNIYEIIENNNKKYILIIYNISANHYVGLDVNNTSSTASIYINSINKYVDIDSLEEYSKNNIKQLVYVRGKFLKIDNNDFFNILKLLKKSLFNKLNKKIDYTNIEDIKFLKWCYDKMLLEENQYSNRFTLKPRAICWVDFGQNIGSELRKLRPAILWRSSSDKKMWTVIPLSTKCFNDKYYFHCDLTTLKNSTAKIESMANFSYKRIKEPFFYGKKIAHISQEEYLDILSSLNKYYIFKS